MSEPLNKLTLENFTTIYSQVPRLTVEIILRKENGVLLTLRKNTPYKDMWSLPGGTVLLNESVEDAVKRVAQEELGIMISIEKFLGYIDYLQAKEHGGFDHPVGLAFLCATNQQSLTLDAQAEKAAYFSELPINIVPEQQKFLTNIISNSQASHS